MIRKTLIRLFILLISVVISLIILEIGVRLIVPQPIEEVSFEDIYTTRFSLSLNRFVKSLNPDITRYKNGHKVYINNDGNRDHRYSKKNVRGVKRIAIVGSSVTFGFNLALEDTYGKQLEELLNHQIHGHRFEVLNFGRPGFKAKETYALINDVILDYEPDLIIYSFVQNNYETQSYSEFIDSISQKSATPSVSVHNKVSFLRSLRNKWRGLRNTELGHFFRANFHLYLFSANSIANILRELSPTEKENAQNIAPLYPETVEFQNKITNTESWISQMNQECINNGIKFAVLMHPYEMQVSRWWN